MGELLPSQPRPSGPRVLQDWENPKRFPFYVDGITDASPSFASRQEAEIWLRKYLARQPAAKRPMIRACMRCGSEFQSEGFHKRMCGPCRHTPEGIDGSPYRVIRPSKRG